MRAVVWALVVSLLGACGAEEPTASPGQVGPNGSGESGETTPPRAERAPAPEIARPYEEGADAQAQIDAALASSRQDQKRVLLVFGANWCPWCRRLDWVLQNDANVSSTLTAHYRLVHVDVGPRESSTNRDLARRYGDPIPNGLPCLVVLDREGGVAHVQETGALEDGDRHDPARVLAFLERFASSAN